MKYFAPTLPSSLLLPPTAAGLPLIDAVFQICMYITAGVALNTLVHACLPKSCLVRIRTVARDGEAGMLYTYALCAITQLCVFPVLYMLSVWQYPNLRAHCAGSWEECAAASGDGICWMRVLSMVIVAYLAKDLGCCDGFMEVLHHVAGLVVTVGFMLQERGMYGYITACVALEFANFFMNLGKIWPYEASRLVIFRLTVLVMTASHIVGLYMAYFTFINRGTNDNTAFSALFVVMSVGVCFVRQRLNYAYYCVVRDSVDRQKKA